MTESRSCQMEAMHTMRRICFQCATAICASCQIKIDHHLFCAESCHREYLNNLAEKTTSVYKKYAAYATVLLLLVGFLYFALLADAFYNGGDLDAKTNSANIGLSLPVKIAEEPVEEIVIRHPLNGMISPSQILQVEGQAPNHSVVVLYLNGAPVEKTVANGGAYKFSRVMLAKQTNILQTRFYAENGWSDWSEAIMVLYRSM